MMICNLEKIIEESLLEEVYTTPKPGLVDLHDSGAHKDMTPEFFEKSARTIAPYLAEMLRKGYDARHEETELFAAIREDGKKAQEAMFAVTKGVNTHKGAIFTLGILCAAAGRVYKECGRIEAEEVLVYGTRLAKDSLLKEIADLMKKKPITNGDRILRKYGKSGIRDEVIQGFPTIMKAYQFYIDAMKEGHALARVKVDVLLYIMTMLYDTNVINRGGEEGLLWIRKQSEHILAMGGACKEESFLMIEDMNRDCIKKNISSGGAADILAAVFLLYKFEHMKLYGLEEFNVPELASI